MSDIIEQVKEYYGKTLNSTDDLQTSACCCSTDSLPRQVREVLPLIADEILDKFYGCGSPLPPCLEGATVLDLGCGTGRDVYVASKLVGPSGRVIGVDMTDEQIAVARAHQNEQAERFGYASSNVEFKQGYIEDLAALGIADNSIDVVISNCVINLSDDKRQALREARRVLRPHGRLCVTDIVLADPGLDAETRRLTAPILGCTNGVLGVEEYLDALDNAGFSRPAVDIYRPYAARTLLDLAKQQGAVAALAHLSSTERKRSIDNAFAAAYITGYR